MTLTEQAARLSLAISRLVGRPERDLRRDLRVSTRAARRVIRREILANAPRDLFANLSAESRRAVVSVLAERGRS